jgi:hypothetical protein
MVDVPCDVGPADGGWRARLRAKAATHPTGGKADEQVIRRGDPVRAKEAVLGTIGAAGRTKRESPSVDGTQSGPERTSTGITNKLMGGVGRHLESIVLHRPQQENGVTMRRGGREMPEMGPGDVEGVTEAVKPTHITLVAH